MGGFQVTQDAYFKLLRLQKLFLPKGPAAFIFIQMAQLPQSPTEKITDVCLYFSPLVSTTVDILFSFFLSCSLSLSAFFFFFFVVGSEDSRGVFRWAKGLEAFEIAPPSPRRVRAHTHTPQS